jgi:hypothetical protein
VFAELAAVKNSKTKKRPPPPPAADEEDTFGDSRGKKTSKFILKHEKV